ncbi:MAG: oligopeptide/dipeptide ABC transporter ATP-binding protein, partial [Planctomycetota bacterium]
THDLAVVAEFCDRVVVMYGGKVQECADVVSLFKSSLHPYTQGLMKSIPNPDSADEKKALYAIPGTVPGILEMPPGCRFANRCDRAEARCHAEEPRLVDAGGGHQVRCHLVKGTPCE